jgi:hypothetical protein
MTSAVIAIHTMSTLMMTGLIWFVQLVHYPLFSYAGKQAFVRFEKQHVRRTTWIVLPLMIAEAVTALALVILAWNHRDVRLPLLGLFLLVIIWASTLCVQVPCHKTLAGGFNAATADRLVRTNWIRTVAWTARGVVAVLIPWVIG